jgi:2-polyprenyl-3-methyl-5-hydroxy-6-metoxy-1,4-benzoquinol methylase
MVNGMPMEKIVDPQLYDKEYYLTHNCGYEEFLADVATADMHFKYREALLAAGSLEGKKALDIGCGRGEMVYYAARAGAQAVGIDYSEAAIALANEFRLRLPEDLRSRMMFRNIDAGQMKESGPFDRIFLIEVWEHMYDHQINGLLDKVRDLLAEGGLFVMTTPNGVYEKYLYTIKHVFNIPFNLIKFPLRIARGKWKPKSWADFFRHIFKIRPFSDVFMEKTHVNVSSPVKIRRMLAEKGFSSKIAGIDPSRGLFARMVKSWGAPGLLIVARKKA